MLRLVIFGCFIIIFFCGCQGKIVKVSDVSLTEVQIDHIESRTNYLAFKLKLSKEQREEVKNVLILFSKEIQAIKFSDISESKKISAITKIVRDYDLRLKDILSKEQYKQYSEFKINHIKRVNKKLNLK